MTLGFLAFCIQSATGVACFVHFGKTEKKDDLSMNIHIYGTDARLEFCREYLLKSKNRSLGNVALLPVPTTKDGKTLHGTKINLDTLSEKLVGCTTCVGYEIPKDLRGELSEGGVAVIDVSRDEKYLAENAVLTAIGTVGRILSEERAAPCDLSFGIIGFGRIGQKLLNVLMYLEGRVVVFTSKNELRSELCMLGVSGGDSLALDSADAASKISGLDILINTAPARLINESLKDRLANVRIIELASGDNFPEGLAVERFVSVPAAMYPKSAGFALARSVLRMLGEAEK